MSRPTMPSSTLSPIPPPIPQRHRGAGLVIALVVLVVMSISGLALVRTVSAGLLVSGNFAFRQAALLAADVGGEAAIAWLTPQAQTAAVLADQPQAGYYASVTPGLDFTGPGAAGSAAAVDWNGDRCSASAGTRCIEPSPPLPMDPAGHVVRYLIERLCRAEGSPEAAANSCLLFRSAQGGSASRGQLNYGASTRFQPNDAVYYRITVHVRGPRDTTAFTQTLVHF